MNSARMASETSSPEIAPSNETTAPQLLIVRNPPAMEMPEVIARSASWTNFASSPASGTPFGDQLLGSFQSPAAPPPVHV